MFLIFFTIFICIFFIPVNLKLDYNIEYKSSEELLWPSPNYYKINSFYGKRNAPTAGASYFHKGLDIGAPEGSEFIAVTDGTISFLGFLGRWRIYNYIKFF